MIIKLQVIQDFILDQLEYWMGKKEKPNFEMAELPIKYSFREQVKKLNRLLSER